jgi:sugar phosphate isomerase/epimerase
MPSSWQTAGMSAPPLSVQLYSLRDAAAQDFPAVLRRLGDIGFVGVELAGFHGHAPSEVASIIAEAGMQISSAHIQSVYDGVDQTLDELASIGCMTAVLAWLPPDQFNDADTVSRNAAAINAAAAKAAQRGMRLGYHNHWWEFQQSIDGVLAWNVFLSQLDPSVFVELDMYWATLAGQSPQQLIGAADSRVKLMHVKDGPADVPESPMVSAGSGTLPVADILNTNGAVEWHIVELDRCATDMFEAVHGSYTFLTTNGLSIGRR